MIWVKDWNEDREDHGVDIFNIIQKVQDTVIHLEVDEGQWKITRGSKRQAQWVWSPRAMSCLLYGSQILLMHKKQQRSTRLDRKQENGGRVFSAPGQKGYSVGKSEAVVDIAGTHLAVFDIATKLYTLDVILEYSLF